MTSVGELLAEIQNRADAADVPRLIAALQCVLGAREQMQRERAALARSLPKADQTHVLYGYDKCIELLDSALAAALEPAPEEVA